MEFVLIFFFFLGGGGIVPYSSTAELGFFLFH